MYEMLCGRPVFDGDGVGEVIAKQIYEEPEPPRQLRANASPKIEEIILSALAKQPDQSGRRALTRTRVPFSGAESISSSASGSSPTAT